MEQRAPQILYFLVFLLFPHPLCLSLLLAVCIAGLVLRQQGWVRVLPLKQPVHRFPFLGHFRISIIAIAVILIGLFLSLPLFLHKLISLLHPRHALMVIHSLPFQVDIGHGGNSPAESVVVLRVLHSVQYVSVTEHRKCYVDIHLFYFLE